MAAWAGGSWFANKLLAFKRGSEKSSAVRPRRATPRGQPLGWMVALFAAITLGLQGGLGSLRLEPAFMQQVIPAPPGFLLPILWFLVPAGCVLSPSCASEPSAPGPCCCRRWWAACWAPHSTA